jgi:hypothetical protein
VTACFFDDNLHFARPESWPMPNGLAHKLSQEGMECTFIASAQKNQTLI